MILLSICHAGLAHRAEHSPCKREAGGSSPPASTTVNGGNRPVAGHRLVRRKRRSIRRCGTIMHSWRNGRRSRLRSGRRQGMEVQVLPGAPTFARFAKRPWHRSYTPTSPGSSPGASPTSASLVWRPKAPVRHTGDPRFEPATKHHHLSRSSTAERPADNRKTVVRYHAEEPST